MKKILLLCLVLLVVSACSMEKNIDDNIQNNSDVSQNDDINKNSDDNNDTNKKYYDCSFTKTYRIVNKLDGYVSATNTFDYIVVDSFQSFVPVVISIPLGEKEKLEIDKYYEFTYTLKGTGTIEDMEDIDEYMQGVITIPENVSNLDVNLKIKSTEKVGLEQINESICTS